MSKIAIVGVKGSGKTVLMTALGDRYQTADSFGLLLSPENPDAFAFVRVNMAKMRGGEWPMETPHDSVRAMRWSLQREQAGGSNKVICDLDFLDFGGEIYTEAFGNGPSEKSGLWESECATLKGHIGESQMLVVLVNLRDVVSGATDPDTLAALWVTKGMLDYASRDLKLANLAIAFTQVDAYRDVVEACGGLAGVLKKYMPHVYNAYRTLPLFALSAVDKTVEGRDGLLRPAPDFGSQGLDELLVWMLGCTETGKEDADEIAAARARPHGLWQEIVSGMEALRADAVQPTGLSAAAERCAKIAALQAAAAELAGNALRHEVKGFSDEDLANRLAELDDWAKRADQTRAQWALVARKRRIVTSCAVAAILALAALVTAIAVMCHNASVDRLVAEQGYSYTSSLGVKTAVWLPGKKHPTSALLKTAEDEGEWVPTRPGYEWVKGTADVRWCPGVKHPDNPDLVSADSADEWRCGKIGWEWVKGTSRIEWRVGARHPDCADLIAAKEPDVWVAAKPGYEWVKGSAAVRWKAGLKHPDNSHLVSTDSVGEWTCAKAGWKQVEGTTRTEWQVGVQHPQCADLTASDKPDVWKPTKPGYEWDGDCGVKWKTGVRHPENRRLVSANEPDQWTPTEEGYVWTGGASCEWRSGIALKNYPHWVTTDRQGYAKPAPGYVKKDANASGWCELKWNPGEVSGDRKAAKSEGKWLSKVDCRRCDGSGKTRKQVECSRCRGWGKCDGTVDCNRCDGKGKVSGRRTCSSCRGNGSIPTRCQAGCQLGFSMGQQIYGFRQAGLLDIVPCMTCYGRGSVQSTCGSCGGSGSYESDVECSWCRGSGSVKGRVTCPACTNGKVYERVTCSSCDGDGRVWEDE